MRKFILALCFVIILSACNAPVIEEPEESEFISIEELEGKLEGTNAEAFFADVSTAYSLFPISFADSNDDGIGDLKGVIAQLDYLNDADPKTKTDLGIDAVWFNPISPSDTYHKYDVDDYMGIDPKFGTLDDFKMLLDEAHKRGIKIILDMVFNHTSDEHPWFTKALLGEEPYTEYYHVFKTIDFKEYPGKDGWSQKNGLNYYAGFWGEMPDLNADNIAVRNELKAVLDFWINLGVDGFRFDAASHVYDPNEYPIGTQLLQKNKQFWMEMKDYAKSKDPDIYLLAEVWLSAQNAAPYASGFDSLFNFDLSTSIVSSVKNEYQNNFVSGLLNGVKQYTAKNPEFINAFFLSNHDQERVMSQLSGSENKAKLAAEILFSLPGIPFVYYGEELGMSGKKPDEQIREPFVWDGTTAIPTADWEKWVYNTDIEPYTKQVKDADSIWSLYRDLIALRKEHPVFKTGTIENVDLKSNKLLAYTRSDASESILIVHNLSGQVQETTLAQSGTLLHQNKSNTLKDVTLSLEPYGSVYILLGQK
jgi:glycosidase